MGFFGDLRFFGSAMENKKVFSTFKSTDYFILWCQYTYFSFTIIRLNSKLTHLSPVTLTSTEKGLQFLLFNPDQIYSLRF